MKVEKSKSKKDKNKEKEPVEEKKETTSNLLGLLSGLNPKRKCYSVFYFIHYFLIRITIALMILMTPYVSSVYVWAFLMAIQAYCTLQHIFVRMYEAFIDYFIAIF